MLHLLLLLMHLAKCISHTTLEPSYYGKWLINVINHCNKFHSKFRYIYIILLVQCGVDPDALLCKPGD